MPRRRVITDPQSVVEVAVAPAQRRRGDLEPVARSVLRLQRQVGNQAVVSALRDGKSLPRDARAREAALTSLLIAQRQPAGKGKSKPATNPPPPPKWLQDAQAIVDDMAKTDKLLGHVVLKKYSDLNKTLRNFDFGAWTNSQTEIFIKEAVPAGANRKDKKVQAQAEMFIRYELQHEANHIHQFAQAGGPPKTWQRMLEFEQEAYTNDLKFLSGPGKQVITDKDVLTSITSQAQKNLKDITGLLDGIAKLPPKTDIEKHLWTEMKKLELIPSGSALDPTELYKQP